MGKRSRSSSFCASMQLFLLRICQDNDSVNGYPDVVLVTASLFDPTPDPRSVTASHPTSACRVSPINLCVGNRLTFVAG